jgi:hypothetical protein
MLLYSFCGTAINSFLRQVLLQEEDKMNYPKVFLNLDSVGIQYFLELVLSEDRM